MLSPPFEMPGREPGQDAASVPPGISNVWFHVLPKPSAQAHVSQRPIIQGESCESCLSAPGTMFFSAQVLYLNVLVFSPTTLKFKHHLLVTAVMEGCNYLQHVILYGNEASILQNNKP